MCIVGFYDMLLEEHLEQEITFKTLSDFNPALDQLKKHVGTVCTACSGLQLWSDVRVLNISVNAISCFVPGVKTESVSQ